MAGIRKTLHPLIHSLKNHPGQIEFAAALSSRLEESTLAATTLKGMVKVQDSYSLRCTAQVMGIVSEIIEKVLRQGLELADGFMGAPPVVGGQVLPARPIGPELCGLLDELNLALSEGCSLTMARASRMLNPAYTRHLAPFPEDSHHLLQSMGEQAAEIKRLTRPVAADSIETSFRKDVAWYGTAAFSNAAAVLERARWVVAGECWLAARAVEGCQDRLGEGLARYK